MYDESSPSLLSLSLGQFVQLSDEANPGFIECYCAFCNRLIAASKERLVLDAARQRHLCADAPQASTEVIA
jgi:hypothetical protein